MRAITEEFEKQATFYELIEKRIKLLQENIGDGFSNFTKFIEPVTAVTLIKNKIEGTGFDRDLVDL